MTDIVKKPTLLQALIPIIFLIFLLFTSVYVFDTYSLDGSNQISLLLSAGVAALVAMRLGVKWKDIILKTRKSIDSAMEAMLILLMIGALSGTWLISGIVPAMIYYGLQILNPTIFLVAACIISAIVSVATGSSWTTIATVGVALLAIGQALGIPVGMTGGAIISGAYFGDKMSPLSDTTNLAPAMVGTDLFTHIKYMAYTTVPSIIISLIIFLIMGLTLDTNTSEANIKGILTAIDGSFNINGWLFIAPVIVVVIIIKKMPALPALLIGALLGAVFALIFQPNVAHTIGDEVLREVREVKPVEEDGGESQAKYEEWKANTSPAIFAFAGTMKSIYGSTSITTDNAEVNGLLKGKGMSGMLNTVWLIICAMVFGGMMEAGALLKRIAEAIISLVRSAGGLITSTVGTCIFFNFTASDQYMAIVVPGRMYADTYKKKGLKPEVLSRTLEDSGTVTSVLIPWNTCGATQSSVLGVATLVYAPYCFFNMISPIMSIIFGYANIKIRRVEKPEVEEQSEETIAA
ncbi:MAG: Na+/H+ antiporter NhaC family protein [Bacteroidota bacterium]